MSRGTLFVKKISMSIFGLLQPVYPELAINVMWQVVSLRVYRACQGSPLLRLHRNGVESKHTQVPELHSLQNRNCPKDEHTAHVGHCSGQTWLKNASLQHACCHLRTSRHDPGLLIKTKGTQPLIGHFVVACV